MMHRTTPEFIPDPPPAIAALATPPGIGGISVVRVSGASAYEKINPLLPLRRQLFSPPLQRSFFYAVLRDPDSGQRIDEAIVLVFPAPRSYTGETVVEFQVHGGNMSARHLLDVLHQLGIRSAGPGEFTRRAFLNGRLDLSQAEAVMDLIGAQSDRAAHMAVEQLQGALRSRIDTLYDHLMGLCAHVEVSLDFEEGEVPEAMGPGSLLPLLDAVRGDIGALLATWREGILLREGALVVISGRPNAGKSVLFNAMLGRARAIVADQPGTTRDTLEETLTLNGIPLRLVDTAGLRQTDCSIERQGVERATERVDRADLNLRIVDLGAPWTPEDLESLLRLPPSRTVVVLNKADVQDPERFAPLPEGYRTLPVSAQTGQGLALLRNVICETLGLSRPEASASVAVSSRHRDLLVRAEEALAAAQERLPEDDEPVLVAQHLREAAGALAEITGREAGEDLLNAVFERFCIGK